MPNQTRHESAGVSVGERRARRISDGIQMVLDLMAAGAPAPGVLSLLTRALGDELGTPCGLYLLKENQLRLSAGDIPGLPELVTRGARPYLWRQTQEVVLGRDPHTYYSIPVHTETGQFVGILLVQRSTRSRVGRRREWHAIEATAQLAALAISYSKRQAARPALLHRPLDARGSGIIVCDLKGQIRFCSQTAAAMLGVAAPMEGQLIDDLALSETVMPDVDRLGGQANDGKRRFQLDLGDRLLEGEITPLSSAFGRTYGVAVFLQEATPEGHYRQLQDALVANVAHELHAPLAAVSAAVEAICDGIIPERERKRYVQFMLAEMQRLRRLADDLVRLARLDSCAYALTMQDVPAASILREVAEVWSARCAEPGIVFAAASADCTLYADKAAVTEVLTHLLQNALQHTAPGGRVEVGTAVEGALVRISVADSGTGIDPQHLPHLWDRFYMRNQARTRAPGAGVGLGLALVKALVRRMGGDVSAASVPGKGSVFSFTLRHRRRQT